MNRRLREFFSLMAALIFTVMLLSACGQPKPPQTVTIQLDSNPTTGYSWQVSQTEHLFDIESNYTADETEEVLDGVGGTETFVLTAKKPGTCEVSFPMCVPGKRPGSRMNRSSTPLRLAEISRLKCCLQSAIPVSFRSEHPVLRLSNSPNRNRNQ